MVDAALSGHDAFESGINLLPELLFAAAVQPERVEAQYELEVGEDVLKRVVGLVGASDPGKNAGIALPFKSAQSPIQGTATLSDAEAADLLAGKWYANIHTAANPGGELRGQTAK